MKGTLHILIADHVEGDVDRANSALRKGGYDPVSVRVDTAGAMATALDLRQWDLVLCDWSMPQFSALHALELVRAREIDKPFIVLSAAVTEDVTVTALKAGAHDVVSKSNLARLVPAVDRELREAKIRHERNALRDQLMVSDRMASVGILADGLAHEVDDPLASVVINLDLATHQVEEILEGRVLPSRALLDGLTDARLAVERIRAIVQDVKLFSRADGDTRRAIEVDRVLDSTLRMASQEIRNRANVVKHYAALPPVVANESRLAQVFLSLLINAAHSIPPGRVEKNEIGVATSMGPGGRVIVEIRDTGAGITPHALKRVFCPPFTTSLSGGGTGVGLPTCHRLVTSLGGELTVESAIGRGSTFRVSLPAARRSSASVETTGADSEKDTHRGRVLVIDDDSSVAAAVKRTLARDHEVTVVYTAADALARVMDGERFDVIVCDLMMPEMTGMDLYAHFDRTAPDQAERMIFVTGGAFTARARAFLDQVPNKRIEKPFDVAALRAVIDDAVATGLYHATSGVLRKASAPPGDASGEGGASGASGASGGRQAGGA